MAEPNGNRIVVIGASSGGVEALRTLASALRPGFAAPICVVIHTGPGAPGFLHEIIGRSSTLPVHSPRLPERLQPGHIYVAPPDHHLLVEPGIVRLSKGPLENRFRPAIDPLFRTAAQVYGPAAIGVVLTGNLDDGADGLWTIKQLGGMAIVQDPDDALFPGMPLSALAAVAPDHTVPLAEIGPLLQRLSAEPVHPHTEGGTSVPDRVDIENRIARDDNAIEAGVQRWGEPSSYACPDCHGVLLQMKEAGRLRFRCHTGHGYSAEALVSAIADGIEHGLWNALRTLQEGALLLEHLARHCAEAGNEEGASRYGAQAADARAQTETLRTLATRREPVVPVPVGRAE